MPDKVLTEIFNKHLPYEIDMMHGGGDAQINTRMGFTKPAQPIDQPFRRKVRRRADGQDPGVLPLQNALGARGDPVERVAYHIQIFAAGIGDNQTLALAIEKLDAKRGFQRLDLMTNGALGDTQLFSRAREAFAPSRGLESPQGVQWWQLAGHHQPS